MNKFVLVIEDDGVSMWTSYQIEPKNLEPNEVAPISHQVGLMLTERFAELIQYLKDQKVVEPMKLN